MKLSGNLQEDIPKCKKALKQMHATGWDAKTYMSFELLRVEQHHGSDEDYKYIQLLFYSTDESLRPVPLQIKLF